jgi:hypothetical protein
MSQSILARRKLVKPCDIRGQSAVSSMNIIETKYENDLSRVYQQRHPGDSFANSSDMEHNLPHVEHEPNHPTRPKRRQ